MLRMCDTKTVSDDFENANIISIFKKGDRSVCKIVARIFLGRLLDVVEEVVPEYAVFVGDMATPGKKPMNSNIHYSSSFGTFAKPSTRFPRQAMWFVFHRFGCPDHFADHIIALYDGMVGRVCTLRINSYLRRPKTKLRYGSNPVAH